MFPFWESVIGPVLRAVRPRRVVEIGALKGDTTDLLLELLGPDCELHVVDPVPQFDPSHHEDRFPGRYVFHRAVSHDVLPDLPLVDVALIDGDHNWYTVVNELRMLAATATEAGAPLPLLIMHDVGWPYGRRDLYYAPERIPEAFRQPYDQRGMVPGRPHLAGAGFGLNPTLHNALKEGGPRNGVMTALDDFLAECERSVRTVVLPVYFGLALVADHERLDRQPELAAVLDHIESAEGRLDLIELGESLRLETAAHQHGVYFGVHRRAERGAKRYLDLLKASLIDEHHVEEEVRLRYLADCIDAGERPGAQALRDPAVHMPKRVRSLREVRRAGALGASTPASTFAYTAMGRRRLDHLEACLESIRADQVEGDLVECGPGRGGGAVFLRGFLEAHELPDRQLWVAGPMEPAPLPADDALIDTVCLPAVDLNSVREGFARFDLLDDRVRFLQGPYRAVLPAAPVEKLALLRIGATAAADAGDILAALYDQVTLGGFVVIEDGAMPECDEIVKGFREAQSIAEPLERVDVSTTFWRKTERVKPSKARRQAPARPATPVAAETPTPLVSLSVIVVFYNMRREAERTLHSLSRAYQQGIDDLTYEVVAIDNGSAAGERLDDEFVGRFGPEFRLIDLHGEALPSPVAAINRAVGEARGEHVALMIDGAHVLTPGVLRFGMLGLRTYAPAVVTTQQWYLGPGQQSETVVAGYDKAYEDGLFREIEWPANGYRLFDIGHFIGDRDWFDAQWESNCIFVPRRLLDQIGGMDESFAMPGGGYANLDLFERLGSTPGVTLASILGEGSFHQVHSGTTTNRSSLEERDTVLAEFGRHYLTLRGKPYRAPTKPIHFVGTLVDSARRTRPRRLAAPTFFKRAQDVGLGAMAAKPLPVPEELRLEFTDAFWRSMAWQDTSWLGQRVAKCPNDLFVYQQLLVTVNPDWIVETGTGDGGRALFLASVCELLGHGNVISIDEKPRESEPPSHPRITYIANHPLSPKIIQQVGELVGEPPNALVILGSLGHSQRTIREFEAYSPFVGPGSYAIVEDTIVNGKPVWPDFGHGPAEAVRSIVYDHLDFAHDRSLEKLVPTFNPGGFLRRVVPAHAADAAPEAPPTEP